MPSLLTFTPEHAAWRNMKYRCDTPSAPAYSRYGGRGITYCEEWKSFEIFLRDMGKRPSPKHSLERRDNSKGYSKENCYWATIKEQMRNTRRVKLSLALAKQIRIEYAGGALQRELAAKYSTKQPYISNIVRGRNWA